MKPGYKSTEFWLSTAAVILGVFVSSGILGADSPVSKIIGMAISTLAALGYTGARAIVKSGEAKARAIEAGIKANP